MKTWSIYNLETGLLTGDTFSSTGDAAHLANVPPGCGVLDADISPDEFKVDVPTGKLVRYTPPPEAPAAKAVRLKGIAQYRAQAEILSLEQKQTRSTREILLALAGGKPVPADAVTVMQGIEDQITVLRRPIP